MRKVFGFSSFFSGPVAFFPERQRFMFFFPKRSVFLFFQVATVGHNISSVFLGIVSHIYQIPPHPLIHFQITLLCR